MKKTVINPRNKIFPLLGVLILSFLSYRAQTCRTPTISPAFKTSNGNCNSCTTYNDYVPLNSDSILYVRLNFHYLMVSPNTPGFYKNATINEALATVGYVNSLCFDSLHKNSLRPGTPTPYIKRPKIKFVLSGFSKTYDSAAYFSTGVQNFAPLASYINSPDAIDIVFKGDSNPNDVYGEAQAIPGKAIKMSVGGANPLDTNYIWWKGMELFGHELGHALGLFHTDEYWHTCYDDFFFETPGAFNGGDGQCNPSTDSTHSNNLMGSTNYTCRYHISPRQLAFCHFNLRNTFLFNTLTPSSQQIVRNTLPNADINITSNETWTTDRFMKGNITVKAGKTLTIKCTVGMTHGAKIIVEKTALLFVDGGTITNLSGRTWDGIYVWGDPNLGQTISSGMPVYQGMAKFMNGATISHAYIGVRNHNSANYEYGGIIIASNSNFLDNYCDVQFIGSNTGNLISASKFYNCLFKINGLIGDNLHPLYHANMVKSVGVRFYGCNFEFAAQSVYPHSQGKGIYSVNSNFIVDKNGASPTVFKGLGYGIHVNNYNPLRIPSVSNCEFIDNVGYGAYFMNTKGLIFQGNLVSNPGYIVPWCGVYLNNCKDYTIKNNTFRENLAYSYKSSPGLEIHNSTAGSHQVYKNSFSNLSIGINAMGDNSGLTNTIDGLKMNCNDFTQTSNQYDIALDLGAGSVAPSVMTKQGETNLPLMTSANVVRNMYKATCVSSNQNKWYIHSSSNKAIAHGCNATSSNGESTKPTPQPNCSRTIINIATIPAALNYNTACPLYPSSSGGNGNNYSQKLSNMNDYLTSLGNSNHFERQATVASKLNLFLTDTINHMDSVITVLQNNQGNMHDADIQTVFAYIAIGNYSEASTKKNALGTGKADWKDLLTEVIALEQDTQGIYKLNSNPTTRNFFINRAASTKDGNYIAMALLKAACDSNYTEPHNYPVGSGFRMMQEEIPEGSEPDITANKTDIELFPNPTQTGVTIRFDSQDNSPARIEIRDLLGKLLYTNIIYSSNSNHYVAMNEFDSGVYVVTITQNKNLIYKTKVIKKN